MRPGLVAVGIGLLAVAGAVIVAVLDAAEPGPGQSTHLLSITIPSGQNASAFLWGLNGSGVAFALSWHADSGVVATLSDASGCAGDPQHCAPGATLVAWGRGSTAGAWSTASSDGFPWLLHVVNSGPTTVHVGVTTTAARAPVPASTGWSYDLFLVAGATLGGIGALALFLGLFLKGGVYGRPSGARPPPTPPGMDPPAH